MRIEIFRLVRAAQAQRQLQRLGEAEAVVGEQRPLLGLLLVYVVGRAAGRISVGGSAERLSWSAGQADEVRWNCVADDQLISASPDLRRRRTDPPASRASRSRQQARISWVSLLELIAEVAIRDGDT